MLTVGTALLNPWGFGLLVPHAGIQYLTAWCFFCSFRPNRSLPDADGDEMTAFKMTKSLKGHMSVELLGFSGYGFDTRAIGTGPNNLSHVLIQKIQRLNHYHTRYLLPSLSPRLLMKKADGAFKKIGNLYASCKPGRPWKGRWMTVNDRWRQIA